VDGRSVYAIKIQSLYRGRLGRLRVQQLCTGKVLSQLLVALEKADLHKMHLHLESVNANMTALSAEIRGMSDNMDGSSNSGPKALG